MFFFGGGIAAFGLFSGDNSDYSDVWMIKIMIKGNKIDMDVFFFQNNITYCQILARQEEIPQKTSKNISRYFCSSFQGHVQQGLRYTNTQRLNCRCQELDLTYLTVSLVPTW